MSKQFKHDQRNIFCKFSYFLFLIFAESRQDVDEKGVDNRVTTTSVIKFRPTSSDNGVTWACEADHPALTNPPLRSTVLLSVLRKYFFMLFLHNWWGIHQHYLSMLLMSWIKARKNLRLNKKQGIYKKLFIIYIFRRS